MKTLHELDYLKAWLIFFVVASLGGGLVGAIAGALLGGALAVAGASLTQVKVICAIVGFLLSIPISYFTFRFVVSHFLLPKLREEVAPVTLGQS